MVIAGLATLVCSWAFAGSIQFGGDETKAHNVAGTDIALNLWNGAYTNYSNGIFGDIGEGVQEGISWGESATTEGLGITITADSSIDPGDLGVMQNILGVDNDSKVTYKESLSFSFNQDVPLVAMGTAYGNNRRYGVRVNGHATYVLASLNSYSFSSNTILSQGDSLELFGIDDNPNDTDVSMIGLVIKTIPEPSTTALIATVSCCALLMFRRRFRG